MIISVVKGDDGITKVLVEKNRRGRKRTKVYSKVSPASLSRLQRLTWRNHKKAVPFFTRDYIGFTLYL